MDKRTKHEKENPELLETMKENRHRSLSDLL